MSKNAGLSVQWLHSYKIKIPILLLAFFLLIISSIAGVLYIVGKDLLNEMAYEKVNNAGQAILKELNIRVTTATTLVNTLANIAEQLPSDAELHKRLIANLLKDEGSESTIAGGGVWPAPFQFEQQTERRSFFWGRDKNGVLNYFENYNNPNDRGYHHEEWYVPAKYLSKNQSYWSKSYIDPNSLQSMITVSTPIYQQQKHAGVATIDLKLAGLHQLLDKVTSTFNGYAFVIDRNGTFLSFPDEQLAKSTFYGVQPSSLTPFITLNQLSEKHNEFASISALLDDDKNALQQSEVNTDCFDKFQKNIAQEIYQISVNEAELITLALCNLNQDQFQQAQFFLKDDYFLNEPVFISIITMPVTYWRIITVMPYSSAILPGIKIYNEILVATILAAFISILLIMVMLRKFFTKLSLFSTQANQQDNLSYISNADSSLPMPETVQAMPFIGSWKWGVEKRSLWWSDEIYYFCGKNPKRFKPTLKYFVRKIVYADDVNNVLSIVKNAIKTQTACGIEFRIICNGDEIKHVHAQAKIVHDAEGRAIMIKGTATDITRQKEIQTGLAFSATTFQNQDPVLITDTEAKIIKVNKAFSDVSGYSAEEVLGKNPRFLKSGREDAGFYQNLWESLNETGQYEGKIWNRHKNGSVFPQRITITATTDFSGKVINYIAIYSSLNIVNENDPDPLNLAFFDPLTGLVNRRLLLNRIEQEVKVAQRQLKLGGLLLINLDRFKALNNDLGHESGDELLVQFGQRLKQIIRQEDTSARLDGDEFAILLPAKINSIDVALEQALIVANKIKDVLKEPFKLFDLSYEITASIGIAVFPEKILEPEIILRQAESAMYQAKNNGRNGICFFKPDIQETIDQCKETELALAKALVVQQFSLIFQPQVDVDGQCRGAEALIRWQHPEKGVVLPNDFMIIAEQSGLSIDIGEWVINEACRQFSQWQQQGSHLARISINISRKQFVHPEFIATVKSALNNNKVEGQYICIEITEQIIVDNEKNTLQIIEDLKALGIAIAIDDFGTSYTSLTQLKQLPLDQLKIDHNLVETMTTDADTALIIQTIIAMSNHLGLSVIAEGVETLLQKQLLLNDGCFLYQGNLFSEALNSDQLIDFLKNHQ